MIVIYGIPNCNTVKKATGWLKAHGLPFTFHNYKKDGISSQKLNEWSKHVGWQNLINKNGTTWKALSEEEKGAIIDQRSAVRLMVEKTSIIKRPVIEAKGKYLYGFNEEAYKALL